MTTLLPRSFGVEIEIGNRSVTAMVRQLRQAGINVFNSQDGSLNDGSRELNVQTCWADTYPQFTSAWRVVVDGSVRGGCEVVSPILNGEVGLAEVKRVVKIMNSLGAKADSRCGLHVHVGASDLTYLELRQVACRYAAFEDVIDGFVSHSRRDSSSKWCKTMKGLTRYMSGAGYENNKSFVSRIDDRYFKLNLLAFLRHGTVEFRQLEGTTSWTKITNWIQFCVFFVEASRLDKKIVESVNNQSNVALNRMPRELKILRVHSKVDAYDLAALFGVHDVAAPEIAETLNHKYPGCLRRQTARNTVWWDVEIPAVDVEFPKIAGTWGDGVPTSVKSYLLGIAKNYAATC